MGYLTEADRGRRILARCDELAAASLPGKGVTRMYLTPEHGKAIDLLSSWMREAGMVVRIDEAANLIGRYEAGSGSSNPALMIGSHIDSVLDAGKYDGPLGVVCAIDCVAEFNARSQRFAFAIEVVAFGDEEGTRFGSTLIGSRAISGSLSQTDLAHTDSQGISIGQALSQFGLDPERFEDAKRRPEEILAYLELHIEQGPVLEAADLPIGIVSAISAQKRRLVTLSGEPNHAGTVPMSLRRDPLLAGSEIALATERLAAERKDAVGTVGVFQVSPGAINVIPGEVTMSLDIRARSDTVLTGMDQDLIEMIRAIARKRGVEAHLELLLENRSTECSKQMISLLEKAVLNCGYQILSLPSGAGHDGMAMSEIAPIGMIFVRCERGISHSPLEAVTASDVAAGTEVMSKFIQDFSRR